MHLYYKHIANADLPVKEALRKLDELASDAILFIVNYENKLIGSLTDGDLRRGFIKGLGFESNLSEFIQSNPKYIQQNNYDLNEIIELRNKHYSVFPVINDQMQIINVVNFKHQKSYLPVDAVIMAGGRGERLRPLTDNTPKPMLKIGDKPIIEYNIDRLGSFGVDDIWLSIGYLGDQLVDYFGDGSKKGIRVKYVWENKPLGTAGSLTLINDFTNDDILMMNSDLLTSIDFEDFFLFFKKNQADFAVACIPYQVNIPYAVIETDEQKVLSLKEKPTYLHYSNSGIYLMKKEVKNLIPNNKFFNATDLMEHLINSGKKVVAYPLVGYWLDIGKPADFKKAQQDIKQIRL